MPRLPDESHFFARDPASDVLRTHRAAEDEAALRTLDSALLRRRAEFDAQTLDEDDLEFGPLSGPPDATPSFDERVQDLIDPFAGSRVEARARSLADTHRKAFEARTTLAGHQRSDRRMVKTLERVLEDNKQAVTMQPGLIDVALARADTALDKTATALDWSDEEREAQRAAFDKDLAQRLLRADIARGNARSVLRELDDDDLALDPETTAILRREAETAQGHARAAFQADADAAMGDVDETAGAALIAQADDVLADDERDVFAERVRQAQADTAFRTAIRFMTPEAVAAAVDRDVDPLEPITETDRDRRQAIAREVLEARDQDPAGVLMADPTVAGWFADGTPLKTALSRRLQAQLDIGAAAPKVLQRDEARTLAAELNSLPPAARMARLVELADRHGTHHTNALRELAEQGLDRPAQALAAAQGHPALALALIDAQTVGRTKLRDGLDPEEIDAVETAITQALGGADTNGFRFVLEDLTYRAYRQTGDADLAAQDALALAGDTIDLGEVRRAAFDQVDDEASLVGDDRDGVLFGGAGDEDLTGEDGSDLQDDLKSGADLSGPRLIERVIDLQGFIDDAWEHDEETFREEAEAADLNPDRAILLRDILRAAETGMTQAQKDALLERIEALPGDLPNGFRTMINSFTVGEPQTNAREIGGLLVKPSSVQKGGEGEPPLLSDLADALSLFGGRGNSARRFGAKQGNSSKDGTDEQSSRRSSGEESKQPSDTSEEARRSAEDTSGSNKPSNPKTKNHGDASSTGSVDRSPHLDWAPDVEMGLPAKAKGDKFKEWWESEGRVLDAVHSGMKQRNIPQAESFIWRNLERGNIHRNRETKTNGARKRKDKLYFQYSRSTGSRFPSRIHVYGRDQNYKYSLDPITGHKQIWPDMDGRKIDPEAMGLLQDENGEFPEFA